MNKNRQTSHLTNVLSYDLDGNIVLLHTPSSADNSARIPTTAWVRTYVTGLTYATQSYVSTQLGSYVTLSGQQTISGIKTFSNEQLFGNGITLTGGYITYTSGVYNLTLNTNILTANRNVFLKDGSGTLAFTTDIPSLAGYATESYVGTAISNLVASSPAALDTLNELAAALGNDASFSTTVSTALGNRLRIDTASQGLTSTQQGYGRTNLGLGTAALSATGDFAAASHTHTIANVTGLQTALDGKQASLGFTPYNSTNPSGYISGITSAMVTTALGYTPYNSTNPSGYITSSGTAAAISQTIGANGDTNLVYAAIADNDFFRIRVGGASNAGWVEIATADDGTEPIYVRQYTGVFSSLTRTATLLDGSGNTSFPGTVTATTFSGAIAWTNVSSRPTALSQFTNDLGNYGSWAAASHTHDTLYYGASARLWTGTDGTRNSGWAYHQDNSTGLHWPNNGWHLYPKDATDMYMRSGGTESAIVLNTQGTNRGYIYVNGSNEIGFLNNSRSWILRMTSSGDLIMDQNHGNSIVGVYSSTRFQGVYSMGNAYKLAIDGTSPGNLYGISWGHPNAGGQAGYLSDHGMMVMVNGVTYAAISNNIWARGTITANAGAYANGYRLVENNGGSWGISITGSAGSAGSVAWGNVSGRPGWMTSASLIEAHANANEWRNSGFYENSGGGSNWPSQTWYNSVNVRHSNQGNYHGFQIAMSYYDNNLWFRSYQGSGTFQSWVYAISNANIGSQSVSYANTAGSADNLSGFDKTNPSFGAVYANNWFRAQGTCGLYQQDYGGHFARSTDGNYGTWQIWGGARGGYSGLNVIDPSGYWNNLMFEGGNGGVYQQNGDGWMWYWSKSNGCLGLGGSSTSSGYRARTNGAHYVSGLLYSESYLQAAGAGYFGGDVTAYYSDKRLKENIKPLENVIDKIKQIGGYTYTANQLAMTLGAAETQEQRLGVIAQEIKAVFPEVVAPAPFDRDPLTGNSKSGENYMTVKYERLVPVLIEAIKEQQTQIEDLKKQIEYLVDNK